MAASSRQLGLWESQYSAWFPTEQAAALAQQIGDPNNRITYSSGTPAQTKRGGRTEPVTGNDLIARQMQMVLNVRNTDGRFKGPKRRREVTEGMKRTASRRRDSFIRAGVGTAEDWREYEKTGAFSGRK